MPIWSNESCLEVPVVGRAPRLGSVLHRGVRSDRSRHRSRANDGGGERGDHLFLFSPRGLHVHILLASHMVSIKTTIGPMVIRGIGAFEG